MTILSELRKVRRYLQTAQTLVSLTEGYSSNPSKQSRIGFINGDIYIGSGETDAMRLITKVVKKLQEEHPHIQYHLYSGNADDVMIKGYWISESLLGRRASKNMIICVFRQQIPGVY
ncbi:hypothetical protein [Desulfitobacterium dehalogenans]|uniref:hypothetical protein n=1 Tax=Desulfitobacterium dehalogenans TaxID=36854 RepID=UPI003CFFD570